MKLSNKMVLIVGTSQAVGARLSDVLPSWLLEYVFEKEIKRIEPNA